ncbi:molybdopterin-guanine dinucleotide biosynthesis protein A [Tolypothrix sp. NIES-4075]|uniref:molybdenum cofactor guanylyltransferase n=1 Tax=Tolypothrix sp. NIES-4075 TaxID=2005459 RepID=UPI000B5C4278|nr:molybdenum cofactor guanylyltransferase [Tolypothrix sp. NIES-4075]GAX46027.1 molybdopterin-guanine dinucleotide biosynthesis protein A [Tolypothrix sp. NIES-4075]
MTNNLTAIVLAGGKSSRMGQDKALIPIQGVPMLQLVCQIAESCTDQVYVVTPWKERYQHLLTLKSEFIQEVPFSEPLPHGPIIGFAQGLAQVKTDWVLLLACDLPKLQVEVLQEWAAKLDSVGDGAIAALVSRHSKGWEPLCGFYHRRCLPSLMDYINQGGRSFQEWLKQHPVYALSLSDPEMLFNCNTPQHLDLMQGVGGNAPF